MSAPFARLARRLRAGAAPHAAGWLALVLAGAVGPGVARAEPPAEDGEADGDRVVAVEEALEEHGGGAGVGDDALAEELLVADAAVGAEGGEFGGKVSDLGMGGDGIIFFIDHASATDIAAAEDRAARPEAALDGAHREGDLPGHARSA